MKQEYLDTLALKVAYGIFGEATRIFGFPHKYWEIEEMEKYAYCAVETRGYNEKEIPLIKDHLKKLFQEYRSECQYYGLCYR